MEKKLIRWNELQSMLGGISRSTIARWEVQGHFPRRISLGDNSVAWSFSEVEEWIKTQSQIR